MNVVIGNGYWGKIIQKKLKKIYKKIIVLDSKSNIDLFLKEYIKTVFICTPTNTHYNLVKKCIKNNIKTIFCEKPFTGNYKKACELFELANNKNINIFIDNVFLYRNEFLNFNIKNNYNNIKFIWEKNELKKNDKYKDDIINSLLYHDIYLLIKITNIIDWEIIRKNITNDELFLELSYKQIKIIFSYNRNIKNKKIKKIIFNNFLVDFSFPMNDPLFEIINDIKNNKINYNNNNILSLQTLKIIQKIIDLDK